MHYLLSNDEMKIHTVPALSYRKLATPTLNKQYTSLLTNCVTDFSSADKNAGS